MSLCFKQKSEIAPKPKHIPTEIRRFAHIGFALTPKKELSAKKAHGNK